jgi:peptidoglycan/xylan/chitin deacetylase (PgdA/CDA1 family)
LVNSKRVIEELTGREVKAISFPFGKHNSDVVALAHEAGYATQFGLGSAALDGVIERIPVYRIDTPASVKRKVAMDKLEILKSDLIHSFANIPALISVRHKGKAA